MSLNTLLTKNYLAAAAVLAHRIVKFGGADGTVLLATSAADGMFGIIADLGADAGERVDVHLAGLAEVAFGGDITQGDYITAGAGGVAVKATLSAEEIVHVIGQAQESGIAGDIGRILIFPSAAVGALHAQTGGVFGATFAIGNEAAHVRRVSIQLTDDANADLAIRGSVFAYLASDATGDTITAAAPSGGAAIGVDGIAIPLVAGKAFQLVSEADGDIDIDITEATAKSFYLVLVLPNGKLAVSAAITFAG